jgi:hypothetical protein
MLQLARLKPGPTGQITGFAAGSRAMATPANPARNLS